MKIEQATCKAVIYKATADHESKFEYVDAMKEVMKERGHEELFFMILYLVQTSFDWDADEGDEEVMAENLEIRYSMLSTAIMAYSAMLAAQEVDELNQQFAEDTGDIRGQRPDSLLDLSGRGGIQNRAPPAGLTDEPGD